jgi:hypothetical protein
MSRHKQDPLRGLSEDERTEGERLSRSRQEPAAVVAISVLGQFQCSSIEWMNPPMTWPETLLSLHVGRPFMDIIRMWLRAAACTASVRYC